MDNTRRNLLLAAAAAPIGQLLLADPTLAAARPSSGSYIDFDRYPNWSSPIDSIFRAGTGLPSDVLRYFVNTSANISTEAVLIQSGNGIDPLMIARLTEKVAVGSNTLYRSIHVELPSFPGIHSTQLTSYSSSGAGANRTYKGRLSVSTFTSGSNAVAHNHYDLDSGVIRVKHTAEGSLKLEFISGGSPASVVKAQKKALEAFSTESIQLLDGSNSAVNPLSIVSFGMLEIKYVTEQSNWV